MKKKFELYDNKNSLILNDEKNNIKYFIKVQSIILIICGFIFGTCNILILFYNIFISLKLKSLYLNK
jgi:hypothetical protein